MQAKDLRERGRKCPASVAYSKLMRLDDMLQRQKQKRHVMGKAEFRRKMLRRLHQNVCLDEESGAGLQGETSAQKE
jgi:hypothetical protein